VTRPTISAIFGQIVSSFTAWSWKVRL
jgi:hypothetical protein